MLLLNQNVRMFGMVKKYTISHEWIEYDASDYHEETSKCIAKMGITEFAQNELGDVVHIDFPDVGKHYIKGDALVNIESVKTAADINNILDGNVTEINEKLEEDPSLLNTDPEGEGWILKLLLDNRTDLNKMDELLDIDEY